MAEKPEAKGEKPPPGCKAILLCERIVVDADTRRISVVGLINSCVVAAFPGHTVRMRVFLQLVDGIGDYRITVEVHDLAEDRVVYRARGPKISFPDRLARGQFHFSIPSLPILHPGKYEVIVLGNGKEIDRQQFRAKRSQSQGEST